MATKGQIRDLNSGVLTPKPWLTSSVLFCSGGKIHTTGGCAADEGECPLWATGGMAVAETTDGNPNIRSLPSLQPPGFPWVFGIEAVSPGIQEAGCRLAIIFCR